MTTNKRNDVTADNGCRKTKTNFNFNFKQLKFKFTAAPAANDRVKWVTKAVSSADGNIFRCVLFVTRVVFKKYKFTIYKKKNSFLYVYIDRIVNEFGDNAERGAFRENWRVTPLCADADVDDDKEEVVVANMFGWDNDRWWGGV